MAENADDLIDGNVDPVTGEWEDHYLEDDFDADDDATTVVPDEDPGALP